MIAEARDGAQTLLKCLEAGGIEYMFGYSGGAALPIFDALETAGTKIKFVLARHEQGAVHMADGYARATGRPAAVLVTSGPGAGNTITGIMTAHMDSIPMVVISGQQVTWMLGKDAFQEADIFGITMPIVKHSYLVKNTDDIPRITKEALHIATTGRPGPVLIDMPKNISQGVCNAPLEAEIDLPGYHPDVAYDVNEAEVIAIADAINRSKRPVILAGHGAMLAHAGPELKELAETCQIPVTSTLLGKGIFPESHELSLGMLGMHGTAYANKAICEADLIMSVGSRFDDRIIGQADKFGRNATIIHIDIDPAEIGKMIKPDLQAIGDAKVILTALNKHVTRLQTKDWLAHLDGYKKRFPLNYKKQGGLKMQHILDVMDQLTKSRAVVCTDVGQHQMWAAQFCKTEAPWDWISSGGAGTMGFGFPAAIGAQLGRPDDIVVAVVGDGGFQMTLFELSTAVLQKTPVKILILNNHFLGMVRQWQELFFDNRKSGVDLEGNPDFVKLAEAYGAKGFQIKRPADIEKVLTRALEYNDGPCVINCEVVQEDNVFPMIPAGAALEDMIIEKPKYRMEKPVGST
ncbi:MAG: biosynthetic-type acetolactate synthase large subunit [Verrucomicrobia bacterium]|nr:biosynthetic-type acetolactate synthase large subunit [Verrucomicrobiota bacterium]MCH8527641.1 biosynthetic-type acetolactate synthase large subunit [Kiritimatiellia bacterium]